MKGEGDSTPNKSEERKKTVDQEIPKLFHGDKEKKNPSLPFSLLSPLHRRPLRAVPTFTNPLKKKMKMSQTRALRGVSESQERDGEAKLPGGNGGRRRTTGTGGSLSSRRPHGTTLHHPFFH